MLIDKIEDLVKHIEVNQSFLQFNKDIFDIREGDLMAKVEESIKNQITDAKTVNTMVERIPPINVLSKINNKLSTLYTKEVHRETASESDKELIQDYAVRGVNDDFNDANQNYNSYKNTVIEIYEDVGFIGTRSLPSYLFLPYSDDPIDSTRMTVLIKYAGKISDDEHKYFAYSDTEFISFTSKGMPIKADMPEQGWVNPFGVIPFTYINQSRNLLVPKPDKDIKQMTILIPLLLAEINFGNQYLSMPIIYGTDIEASDFSRNANTVMMVKSDSEEKSGSLNVLQPNLNIPAQLMLVADQLSFWLASKDVRAGTFGIKDGESALSALALMIKEMDVTTNRNRQATKFKRAEVDFWQKLATIHNLLVDAKRINATKFSDEDLVVFVRYSGQEVIETREDKARRLTMEVNGGLNSLKNALAEYHSDMTEEQIEKLAIEIQSDRSITIPTIEAE